MVGVRPGRSSSVPPAHEPTRPGARLLAGRDDRAAADQQVEVRHGDCLAPTGSSSTWPTVRAIAGCAGISATSVLWPYGSIEQMRLALIRAERAALASLVEDHGGDVPMAVDERTEQLSGYDLRLTKLPLLVALAAGVHDATELAVLAGAVRSLPAA